ncbi:M1 family aminopeptidase [Palaeococcus sp. (in: euryarchaeotes)]
MKARFSMVIIVIIFTVTLLLAYTPLKVFEGITFSKTNNVKLLFERSGTISGAKVHISLDVAFDGWNTSITGVQEVELSLKSPAVVPFLFENSSILNMKIERIEVSGAEAALKAFHDGSYDLLLLNITPTDDVQRIKILYTSDYQPLLDINTRDPIEWEIASNKNFFYLPPEAYMPVPGLKGNFTVEVESYPEGYTPVGILKLSSAEYKALLPEKNTFHTHGNRFYVLFGKWNVYRKSVAINGKNVNVVALTDEGNVTDELAKLLKVYSSYLIPYPYDEMIYIRVKGHAEYSGHGLYGGALATQFNKVVSHEVAHNWFGAYANFWILNEPFATYVSISLNNLTLERVDLWEGLCFSSKRRTPIVKMRGVDISRMSDTTANLYYRGGFILRSLQFVVGNETFFKGLRELLEVCHVKECTKTEETLNLLRKIFENSTHQDLDWFFKEWFYRADYPNFTVSTLKLIQNDGGYSLMLNISEENGFAMPLEVKIVTPTENITKRIFVNSSSVLSVETKEKPIMVILDPNDWIANVNGSSYRLNWEKLTFEKIEKEEMEINGIKIVIN